MSETVKDKIVLDLFSTNTNMIAPYEIYHSLGTKYLNNLALIDLFSNDELMTKEEFYNYYMTVYHENYRPRTFIED